MGDTMPTLRLVLDCSDVVGQARFWVGALGYRWVVMTDPEGNEFCVCAN